MRLPLIAACLLFTPAVVPAADWPQWRGPDRNEISTESGIRTNFGRETPRLLWTCTKAGQGYSGPSIVGNFLYCLGAESDDFAFAMNVETGKEIWRTDLGTAFKQDRGNGPRSSPTVDGDRLYFVRGGGDVHCLNAKDGKQVWQKSFRKDFGGKIMSGWGYSESPLVDGDKLICTPGGTAGAIVALDKKTGRLIWQSKDLQDDATYSSVIAADVFGVRQYIQMTRLGVGAVRASDGKKLWFYERPGHRTAVVPTPIYHNNHVYVTAGYGCGCDLIKLTSSDGEFKAEKAYFNKNMVNHHGGVVLLDGHIYGYSDSKGWICQDFMTGEIKWTARGAIGKGSLTCAAGHLFCYDESSGALMVCEASPKAFKETARMSLPRKSEVHVGQVRYWTHPVIANGKLYVRDQDLLFCFDVKK